MTQMCPDCNQYPLNDQGLCPMCDSDASAHVPKEDTTEAEVAQTGKGEVLHQAAFIPGLGDRFSGTYKFAPVQAGGNTRIEITLPEDVNVVEVQSTADFVGFNDQVLKLDYRLREGGGVEYVTVTVTLKTRCDDAAISRYYTELEVWDKGTNRTTTLKYDLRHGFAPDMSIHLSGIDNYEINQAHACVAGATLNIQADGKGLDKQSQACEFIRVKAEQVKFKIRDHHYQIFNKPEIWFGDRRAVRDSQADVYVLYRLDGEGKYDQAGENNGGSDIMGQHFCLGWSKNLRCFVLSERGNASLPGTTKVDNLYYPAPERFAFTPGKHHNIVVNAKTVYQVITDANGSVYLTRPNYDEKGGIVLLAPGYEACLGRGLLPEPLHMKNVIIAQEFGQFVAKSDSGKRLVKEDGWDDLTEWLRA